MIQFRTFKITEEQEQFRSEVRHLILGEINKVLLKQNVICG